MGRSTDGSAPPTAGGVLLSASLAMFGVFLVSVVLRVLPPRLLDPLWQVSLTTALLDMGGYALLGVVVLIVAQLLLPDDQRLVRQLERVTRLCGIAGLGFLLLVPLLFSALVRDYQQVTLRSQRQVRDIDRMEQRLQKVIISARSREELLRGVQRVNAPALSSFLLSDAPLENQRSQALELLRDTAATARRQAGTLTPPSLPSLLLNNLRLLLLSLVFAFGFASAHAGRLSFPLLKPLQQGLQRISQLRLPRRRRPSIQAAQQAYFDALAKDEGPEPKP